MSPGREGRKMRRAPSWGRECQAVPAGETTKGREMGLAHPALKCIPVLELLAVSRNPPRPPPSFLLCKPQDTVRFFYSWEPGIDSEYPQVREMPYKELVSQAVWPSQHSASVIGVGSSELWPHGDGSDPPADARLWSRGVNLGLREILK